MATIAKSAPATFEMAYYAWHQGRALLRAVDESDDGATDEWVNRNAGRADSIMNKAAHQLAAIQAQNIEQLARKLEVIADRADYHEGHLSTFDVELAKSAATDAARLTTPPEPEGTPHKMACVPCESAGRLPSPGNAGVKKRIPR